MMPLNGPGTPTVFNADVSVNPASTMKLVTTYAALEMLGPNHQWKTEFYTDGTLQRWHPQRQPLPQGWRRSEAEHGKTLAADARPARQRRDPGHRRSGAGPKTSSYSLSCRSSTTTATTRTNRSWSNPTRCWSTSRPCALSRATTRGKVLVSVEPPIASIRIDNQVKALQLQAMHRRRALQPRARRPMAASP